MFNNLFNMWLEGVKIIISFIPFAIALVLLPALLIVSLDFFAGVMLSDLNNGNIDLIITKIFLPDDVYQKLWKWLNKK